MLYEYYTRRAPMNPARVGNRSRNGVDLVLQVRLSATDYPALGSIR
jgi:hypothetical protein